MKSNLVKVFIFGIFGLCLIVRTPAHAEVKFITLTSTTSTENSGLLNHILPLFTKKTGLYVRVVAVGTGQAMRIAKRGDADVLLVHHRSSEEEFVTSGFGIKRYDIMYNDFIIVGPDHDPAKIKNMKHLTNALSRISTTQSPFISRGDDSGTHKRELSLWKTTRVNLKKVSGTWYRETGSGMGATLNTASALNAYTMTDRGTWLAFQNKVGLSILVEGLPPLFNPYGIIVLNPENYPHVELEKSNQFINWLLSAQGKNLIKNFKVSNNQLFFIYE